MNPEQYPRVLVISHTVLAKNTSMGKTLDSYFSGWPREKIAQLYVQSEVPTDPLCANYFRYTDPDALKSILQRRRQGSVFGERDVRPEREDPALREEMGRNARRCAEEKFDRAKTYRKLEAAIEA